MYNNVQNTNEINFSLLLNYKLDIQLSHNWCSIVTKMYV